MIFHECLPVAIKAITGKRCVRVIAIYRAGAAYAVIMHGFIAEVLCACGAEINFEGRFFEHAICGLGAKAGGICKKRTGNKDS